MRQTTNLRQQWLADIAITAQNADFTLPTQGGQLPQDRFMAGIFLEVEGRIGFTANGPTAALADGIYNVLDKVTVSGYHKPRAKDEAFFVMRGPDIRALNLLHMRSIPYTTGALTTGQVNNDFRFIVYLPFTSLMLPKGTRMNTLLDAPNYQNLVLTIHFGDDKSIFSGQTGTAAWSAYGGATGNPRVRVAPHYAMRADKFQGFLPARVWRYNGAEVTAGDIVAGGATASRLVQVPRGNTLRMILLKTGVKSAVQSSGQNAYVSLSDTVLTNIILQRGTNNEIRRYVDYKFAQAEMMNSYGLQAFPTGYLPIDFVQNGDIDEALDTSGMIGGATDSELTVVADIVTGATSQAVLPIYEEIRGQAANIGAPARAAAMAAGRR